MKYIAIIDLEEKPACCEFVECSGKLALTPLGSASEILSEDECFVGKWTPIKTRPLEEDEADIHPEFDFMYDCELPDDRQEVYVTLANGEVATDTFCRDANDLCYFEYNDGDVKAWMPKPGPYKERK